MIKFFTYFTIDTPYEDEAKELKRTCDEHGLDLTMFGFKSAGKWLANSAMKYVFMKDMLEKHERVVALDADARVLKKPVLFDSIGASIGAHMLEYPGRPIELLDGTLYMTRNALPAVMETIVRCNRQPEIWDQKHLQNIVTELKIPVFNLPYYYCAIDGFDQVVKAEPEHVVIRHTQASRRYRANTDAGVYIKKLQEGLK